MIRSEESLIAFTSCCTFASRISSPPDVSSLTLQHGGVGVEVVGIHDVNTITYQRVDADTMPNGES